MAKPKLSIIIPAYNEERYLPLLLDSIKKQTFRDYGIVIADADSKDKTKSIARHYGAKVVRGGLPSKGRNIGAKAANGQYILFLDADVILGNQDFLQNMLDAMDKKRLACVTAWSMPLSPYLLDRLLFFFFNAQLIVCSHIRPRAPGCCICVTNDIFNRIGGFDESIRVSEEHDFMNRMAKHGRFKVLSSNKIWVSVRRLEREGRLSYVLKVLKITWYDLICRKIIDKSEMKYDFSGYR